MAIVAALRTTKTQQDSLLPLDRWSSKARYDLVSTAATRRRALALVGLLYPLQHTGFHLAKTGFKGRDTNGNRRKDYIYGLLYCLIVYMDIMSHEGWKQHLLHTTHSFKMSCKCFVHPKFSSFGFWYFSHFSCVIFFPFFPSCLANFNQRLRNIFVFCCQKWPKIKNQEWDEQNKHYQYFPIN